MRLDRYHSIFNEEIISRSNELISEGKDVEVVTQEITALTNNFIKNISKSMPIIIFENLIKDMPMTLEEERSERKEFEKRLENTWEEGFDYLEALIVLTVELSTALLEVENTNKETFEKIDFLIKIHSNAIVISKEILLLLKSGFVDGAMARWRSLHEANVIFHVVSSTYVNDGEMFSEIKQRYLDYSTVDEYQRFVPNQEIESDVKRKRHIDNEYRKTRKKYGNNFSKPNGWAYPLFSKEKEKITFWDLEKLADYESTNVYYKEANHHVHISSIGINESLGFMPFYDNSTTYLYGPSNYGLSKPGQLTSISLLQITTKLLILEPNIDKLIMAATLKKFTEKCIDVFSSTQGKIREEEHNRNEEF